MQGKELRTLPIIVGGLHCFSLLFGCSLRPPPTASASCISPPLPALTFRLCFACRAAVFVLSLSVCTVRLLSAVLRRHVVCYLLRACGRVLFVFCRPLYRACQSGAYHLPGTCCTAVSCFLSAASRPHLVSAECCLQHAAILLSHVFCSSDGDPIHGDVMRCHVMAYHMACHVIPYHGILSYHGVSYHVMCPVMSCHVLYYHAMSSHVMQYRTV